MNHVERFKAVMNFKPFDRLPRIEWAARWGETLERWHKEGLSRQLTGLELEEHFGLDPYVQYWVLPRKESFPQEKSHGCGFITNADEYQAIKKHMFPPIEDHISKLRCNCDKQAESKLLSWFTFEGFFWLPRVLFGIETHLYAFYDSPELMHQINQDYSEYLINILNEVAKFPSRPAFMTLAEDMSYNHGPMLSKELFQEFLAPYYRPVVSLLEELDIVPIIDTDGDVTSMVPWLLDVGIGGVLPLERQANVDASFLRQNFPTLGMIGHFDKMVMPHGEEAMRQEFERLLPTMRRGGFIPSVDHQTPPGVSLENYYVYLRLLKEYTSMVN